MKGSTPGGPALERGPICEACGCYALEHQHQVDEAWSLVPGPCLTCGCQAFVAKGETVACFVYDRDGG